jgi:adenosine kinase
MSIICTGSIAFDYLMTFPGYFRDHILPDKLESISLSFLVETMVRHRGGCAPNIAYTLALLGDHPHVLGTVGVDFGEYRDWLENLGILTRYTRTIPGKFTASFFANTDLANNQICSFYPGAMAHAAEISLRELDEKPDMVVISPNDPAAMDLYVRECVELGYPYLYDPSQQVVRTSADELRRGAEGATCLFVNEYEYELLRKHTGLTQADLLQTLRFLVITLGKEGAAIYADGNYYRTPVVPPAEVVDPTGVGDAFRGGFLRGYHLGLDWQTCGQIGALAATYCLENKGTQNHCYTPAGFVARYRQHFDDRGALDVLVKQIS